MFSGFSQSADIKMGRNFIIDILIICSDNHPRPSDPCDHPTISNVGFHFPLFCCLYVLCGEGFSKDGVSKMVKAYLEKKVMLDEFITHNMALEQVNDSIELMKHGKW